jgi:hypothetical protein
VVWRRKRSKFGYDDDNDDEEDSVDRSGEKQTKEANNVDANRGSATSQSSLTSSSQAYLKSKSDRGARRRHRLTHPQCSPAPPDCCCCCCCENQLTAHFLIFLFTPPASAPAPASGSSSSSGSPNPSTCANDTYPGIDLHC